MEQEITGNIPELKKSPKMPFLSSGSSAPNGMLVGSGVKL